VTRPDVLDSMSDREILRMAARHLARLAEDTKRSHTVSGKWINMDAADTTAKFEHDLARALAARLRAIAGRRKRNGS